MKHSLKSLIKKKTEIEIELKKIEEEIKIKEKYFSIGTRPINRYVKGNFQHKGLLFKNLPKNQKGKF